MSSTTFQSSMASATMTGSASQTIPSSVMATMSGTQTAGMPMPTEKPPGFYGDMTPDKAVNLAGVILFAIFWGIHTGLGLWFKQWWFLIAFFIGNGLETAGYIGRFKSSDDVYNMDYFLVQIICLTLGPAFLMGGVYYLLAKLVTIYNENLSILKPMHYSLLFICCDILSIVIQAAGGGVASTALKNEDSTDTGTHIMVAGIAFQVFTMSVFLIFFFVFMWRMFKAVKRSPDRGESEFNPQFAYLRQKFMLRWFPLAITLAVLAIYIRCVYRVAELAEGWDGFLIQHEPYVLALDGLMVLLSVIFLTIIHPGFALGRKVIPVKGLHKKDNEKGDYMDNQSPSMTSNYNDTPGPF